MKRVDKTYSENDTFTLHYLILKDVSSLKDKSYRCICFLGFKNLTFVLYINTNGLKL